MQNKHPEIYWSPCPETNRAFLCVAGVDNNIAEIFPVEHESFLSAHDTACMIARKVNGYPKLLEALRPLAELDKYLSIHSLPDYCKFGLVDIRNAARAAIAEAEGKTIS